MEGWVSLLLLLHCTAVTVSQTCSDRMEGRIAIFGIKREHVVAGRLEICIGNIWRAVLDSGWDDVEARIACEMIGFPREGAASCTGSCFGRPERFTGLTDFMCEERDTLTRCGRIENRITGGSAAGVICTNTSSTPKPTIQTDPPDTSRTPPPDTTLPPSNCTTNLVKACIKQLGTDDFFTRPEDCNTEEDADSSSENLDTGVQETRIGEACSTSQIALGVMGGVLLISLLALVGVVAGWVWSCSKKSLNAKQRASAIGENSLENPYYNLANPSTNGIDQTTPTTSHARTSDRRREYQEVGPASPTAYEVPIQTTSLNRGRAAGVNPEARWNTFSTRQEHNRTIVS